MIAHRYQLPGLTVSNHKFTLPLDYDRPEGERIDVFAREVIATEKRAQDLPFLCFFQGGPGFGAPRPKTRTGWLKRAVEEFRVLLLDQRGTGLSSPISYQTLAVLPADQERADYLAHFRADNIVRDAEVIRKELLGDESKWGVLGQSFGGFCVLNYLSTSPEALSEAFITGGIPSLTRPADDIYRATYPQVKKKNALFFTRYPHAQALCQEIAEHLRQHDVRLPNSQRFTIEQFQQLGLYLGDSEGMETLYYLLELAFVEVEGERSLAYAFLHEVLNALNYHSHPIFSVLHEAIYCQGSASNWAAERIRNEFPEFHYEPEQAFCFTGEMIYPWMFDQYLTLTPLKGTANILSQKDDWPMLYDPNVLKGNQVPVAAAVYFDDMYVPTEFSRETAQLIPSTRLWITNEYEHNGLRADGERVLDTLIKMAKGLT